MKASPEWVIQAKQLSRHFGDLKAIDQLDLNVEKSTIYGFLGPNGCGKTTAIRMLTGLLKPTSGEVRVLGLELPHNAEKLRLKMGYMTQKFSLYNNLTVKENLQFIAKIYGISGLPQKQRISELLSVYGLDQKQQQLAGNLSGGQRQRLALAAATLHKPQLLFLDEPTSAVDPQNRREFWEQLFDLCEQGTSILVSTHYMDEAERCHKLAILENGLKRADGSPEALMNDMAAHVVEIEAAGIRQLKQQIIALPNVITAAQLGARLRVLVSDSVNDARGYLQQHTGIANDKLNLVRPSLEDVFITCTGGGRQ
ncbi:MULTISPECIES: ABC transporter ATP-binding protein [Alteromonadaceae]|uniref:ABC transporter ATP-binding protein n=1 Tax=Alteromonadaceae TaxID=72275 RepID=UPI001C09D620|nr:ABC transporter ATP-binding protein [Aliiglaciecola lipolytica]MBU2876717.1 ABC transporter ATP-binding protein [Aliiglaciecola lipolytica]